MNTELMFSSKTDLWATPQDFFNELDKEFNFTLDPYYIYNKARDIRFVKGRLKFGNSKNAAPFPSMVVIF